MHLVSMHTVCRTFAEQTGGKLGGRLTNGVSPGAFRGVSELPGCECGCTAVQPCAQQ